MTKIEMLQKQFKGLLKLLLEENEQILKLASAEEERLFSEKARIKYFPKKESATKMLKWIFNSIFFHDKMLSEINKGLSRVEVVKSSAKSQGKILEQIVVNLSNMDLHEVSEKLMEFDKGWFVKELPKSDRDKYVFFPIELRSRNIDELSKNVH